MVQLQVCAATMQEQHRHLRVSENPNSSTDDVSAAPPPPPPPPSNHRRPRVREVSSRFMSPSVSRRQRQEADSNSTDENSETPFPIGYSISQRKQRAVKLFKENNGLEHVPHPQPHPHPSKSCSGRIGIGNNNNNATPCASSRPDTPTPTTSVSSRYRLTHHRSIISNGNSSAASKLLQASGMSNQAKANGDSICSIDNSSVNCSIQSLPELCSEGDRDRDRDRDRDMLMPNVSTRSVAEKIGNSGDLKFHGSSPFYRSISLPSSGCEHLLVHSIKGTEKQQPSSFSKQFGNQSNHVKLGGGGGLSLPPVPPQCAKPAVDIRKGKKGSSHQEDVHSLRLLYNRYLQWRYANAKAESAMKAQQKESEKALYSHAMRISEMRDSVKRKRIELELLRRSKILSTILEAQIPYLDEWSALEEDYSVSITEAIQALLNASVQLPIGGNVRVDVREVGETLNSGLKMMETIISNIQRFMPKAEETDISISELAKVVGGERALIGECGDLLSKTYKSQVEECSLRGQLIQLHSICHKKKE
ncbi:protein ENDOSPERM DEFECTIVE 1-like [Gastrolobium bilobum]|uniref:protein ENDOSPERM DEFECTIVE 1-like n=1 Tax=Gastrolobium bilobum TaxID=150636 RepID=UPI002AAFE932|nr:protein ENDOSPERM DEFECTIVE 1-like [Gastrolobium bilobum]